MFGAVVGAVFAQEVACFVVNVGGAYLYGWCVGGAASDGGAFVDALPPCVVQVVGGGVLAAGWVVGLHGADAPGWVVQQALAVVGGVVACGVCWGGLAVDCGQPVAARLYGVGSGCGGGACGLAGAGAVAIHVVGIGGDAAACIAVGAGKAGEAVAVVVLQADGLACSAAVGLAVDVGDAVCCVVLVGVQAAGNHAAVGIIVAVDGAGLWRACQVDAPTGNLPQGVGADVAEQRLAVEGDAGDVAVVVLVADLLALGGGEGLRLAACGVLVAHAVAGKGGGASLCALLFVADAPKAVVLVAGDGWQLLRSSAIVWRAGWCASLCPADGAGVCDLGEFANAACAAVVHKGADLLADPRCSVAAAAAVVSSVGRCGVDDLGDAPQCIVAGEGGVAQCVGAALGQAGGVVAGGDGACVCTAAVGDLAQAVDLVLGGDAACVFGLGNLVVAVVAQAGTGTIHKALDGRAAQAVKLLAGAVAQAIGGADRVAIGVVTPSGFGAVGIRVCVCACASEFADAVDGVDDGCLLQGGAAVGVLGDGGGAVAHAVERVGDAVAVVVCYACEALGVVVLVLKC